MSLLSKSIVVDNVRTACPLLLHPSSAIRQNIIGFIASSARFLGVVDSYVLLLPLIRPALKFDLIGYELTEKSLKLSLLPPLSRKLYQQGLRKQKSENSTVNRTTSKSAQNDKNVSPQPPSRTDRSNMIRATNKAIEVNDIVPSVVESNTDEVANTQDDTYFFPDNATDNGAISSMKSDTADTESATTSGVDEV
jgi:hypothetical protein